MKLVIVGAGKVGETLVAKLTKENHDIIVVDEDPKAVETVVNRYDARGIVGNGGERSILLNAECDTADFFVACTSRDELNLLCCVLAKKLGAKHTMARVRDPEYFNERDTLGEELEVDMLFNPEYRIAIEIAQLLRFPSAINIETFAGGKIAMIELRITEKNPIVGKSLLEIAQTYDSKVLFCMVTRGDSVFIPRGDFVIKEKDTVYIAAPQTDITNFCKKLHVFKQKAKSVFIIGGGKIAYYLAQELIDFGVDVKIIEQDEKRCVELSEELPRATIILGDGTDQEVLDEENLKSCDGCVTLTGMDEENVIISLYALSQKVGKVITKVDRTSIGKMVKQLGLDTVVSPRNVVANQLIRYVRANQTNEGEGINALYRVHDKAEALEFTVSDTFKHTGIPLKELNAKLRQNVLICGIVRDNLVIIPNGDTTFEKGDKVLIVTTAKKITNLSQIVK